MKKFFILSAVIGILAIVLGYRFYVAGLHHALNANSNARIVVDIPQGASAHEVANLLYEKELIKSPAIFRFYLKQNDLADKIKAGRSVVQENFDLAQIADALVAGGKSAEAPVTLLEGWTLQQMADHLEEMGLTTAEDFMTCIKTCTFDFDFLPEKYLEGYLYPDTYFVDSLDFNNDAFITRLIGTLQSKLTAEDWQAIKDSGRTLEEIMIMASIVEREERNPEERSTVAGILWNRFDAGQGLGADATVLYGLGRTSGGLTYDDLQSDSPYNTRKYRGLPPTPISNPNISSIRAALYPEKTDYWYYLHDPEGGIHYGKTLEEHNENKRRYL